MKNVVKAKRRLSIYKTELALGFDKWRKEPLRILKNPFFLIVLWSLWISAAYWILGEHSYMRIHDCAESNFAFRAVTAQIYSDYGFSAGIPNFAGGIDGFITNSINYFTYDFTLFYFLPDWFAYALIMFLQGFLATYFTYRLCKDFLRLSTSTAILAGLFWSLGTWTTNDWTLFDGFGLPLIPLYLYLLETSLNKPGWKKYAWASFTGLLLSYFSFFPLFTPFFIVGSFFWLWIVRSYSIKSCVPVLLCFGLFSFTFDFQQLYAIALNAPLSGRVGMSLISIPAMEATQTVIANILRYFWTYAVLWGITLIGLLFVRFKDKQLIRLTIIGIGFALGSKILWAISVTNRDSLGYLSVINFNDFALIAAFIPSVAAAYAIDSIKRSEIHIPIPKILRGKKQQLVSISLFSLLLFGSIGVCIWQSTDFTGALLMRSPTDNYAYNFKNPDLLRLAGESNNHLFRVATVGLSHASAYSASGKNFYPNYAGVYGFEAADGYLSLYSNRYEDFWGEVIRPLRLNDSRVDKRWSTRPIWIYLWAPSDGSHDKQEAVEFADYYNLNLLSLANVKYLISRWQLADPNLELVSSPTHALAQRQEWNNRSELEKVIGYLRGEYPPRPLYIYENKAVMQRAFLTPQIKVFDTADELLDTLSKTPVDEISSVAFLESADVSTIINKPLGFSNSEVKIIDYTPDRIVVSVDADGPGIMVMTNNYSPFWKVWVDGTQKTIFPVYHTFQGVCIDAGKHEVVFEYGPPYKLF